MEKDDKVIRLVRITAVAKYRLELIAKRKNTTLSEAASRIILHYAENGLDYETSSLDDVCQSILKKITGIDVQLFKLIGPIERTEDFIRGLVRESRNDASEPHIMEPEETQTGASPAAADSSLSRALELLTRLLSMAKATTDFEGRAAMQIRLPQEDFMKIKLECEQLCTSQNL